MSISAYRLLRHKIWHVATSKLVMLPAIVGAAFIAGDPASKPLIAAGGVALAFAGVRAIKEWLSDEHLTDRDVRNLQSSARSKHTQYLRDLRRVLRSDRDPRTSSLIKRLQKVYDRLLAAERHQSVTQNMETQTEVLEHANELYQSCLRMLERSVEIWRVSRDVATDSARQELIRTREELVSEVQEGIRHLEETLDHLQTAQLDAGTDLREDSARLRKELDQGLEIARRVEARMQELEVDLESAERSP